MKQTAKQQLLSKYVCLADTEERRMLIEMSAEKGGVKCSNEGIFRIGKRNLVMYDQSDYELIGVLHDNNRKLIDTTTFCKYLIMSEEECDKLLNEDRRVEIKSGTSD